MTVKRIVGKICIEQGVPIPPIVKKFPSKYDFIMTMDVGDSFSIPKSQYWCFLNGIRKVRLTKATKLKVTYRRESDSTYRCWRIA